MTALALRTIVLAQGLVGFEMNLSLPAAAATRARGVGLLGDNNTFAVSLETLVGPAICPGPLLREGHGESSPHTVLGHDSAHPCC